MQDFSDKMSAPSPGFLQHFSPIAKLLSAFGLIIFIVAIPGVFSSTVSIIPAIHFSIFFLLVILAITSRIPFKAAFKRLLVTEPFVIVVALSALFQADGTRLFVNILIKSTLSLSIMIMLSVTTPFPEILSALRRLHVPQIMISVLALMYRYLFVLTDEVERMRRARNSRTFTRRRFHLWLTTASVVSQLFTRTYERAERIYWCMSARGWKP